MKSATMPSRQLLLFPFSEMFFYVMSIARTTFPTSSTNNSRCLRVSAKTTIALKLTSGARTSLFAETASLTQLRNVMAILGATPPVMVPFLAGFARMRLTKLTEVKQVTALSAETALLSPQRKNVM